MACGVARQNHQGQEVIFGGGVSVAGDLLLNPIAQMVRERVHVIPPDKVKFVIAELGINGGLIGAALWAQCRCEDKKLLTPL